MGCAWQCELKNLLKFELGKSNGEESLSHLMVLSSALESGHWRREREREIM
jgi:hypothetical protein